MEDIKRRRLYGVAVDSKEDPTQAPRDVNFLNVDFACDKDIFSGIDVSGLRQDG